MKRIPKDHGAEIQEERSKGQIQRPQNVDNNESKVKTNKNKTR